jgi:hypothetical protein
LQVNDAEQHREDAEDEIYGVQQAGIPDASSILTFGVL